MIIKIPNNNSIIRWRYKDNEDWKSAEISDLIKAYERPPCKQITWEQGYELGKQEVFDRLNKIINDNQFPEYVEDDLINFLKEAGAYNGE